MQVKQMMRKRPVRALLLVSAVALGVIVTLVVSCVGLLFFINPDICLAGSNSVVEDMQLASPNTGLSWTPDGSHIVFTTTEHSRYGMSFSNPESRIYVAESDGSNLVQIIGGDGYAIDHSPNVSPNGSRIVYSAYKYRNNEPSYFEIETSALDGSDRDRLTEEIGIDFAPRWLPDGDRIAFLRYSDFGCGSYERLGIYTMDANGANIVKVSDIPSQNRGGTPEERNVRYHSAPMWSPDSQLLAYVVRETKYTEEDRLEEFARDHTTLYTVNADGSDPRRLLTFSSILPDQWYGTTDGDIKKVDPFIEPARSIASPPEWSLDGLRIAFMGIDEGVTKLYTIGRYGSDLREVVELQNQTSEPGNAFWSRDGLRIIFSQGRALYSVNADGSDLHSIHGGDHFSPSPDEAWIAHFVDSTSNVALYTTAPDGSDARALIIRKDDGELEAVGSEQSPSADIVSCSSGVVVPDPESHSGLVGDCEALARMIDTIAVVGLNWNSDVPIADWEGVTVRGAPQDASSSGASPSTLRVRGLSLPSRGLVGTVSPDELANLTALETLNLNYNEHLIGCVPTSFLGQLAGIQRLVYCDQ